MGGFKELVKDHQTLAREHAQTRGLAVAVINVLKRGLLGRLKWLLVGK